MKRYALPDILKGFAVFLIVPVHILGLFMDYPGRESLFGKILLFLGGPIAVPIFMMVMGYFVALSKKNLSQNLFRGAKLFFLGLVLNVGLNFHLLLKIKTEGWNYNPLEYIFGVDILFLAGIGICILAFLKTIGKGQTIVILALIIAISSLSEFMNGFLMVTSRNYILPFIAGPYSWSYFPIFPWLVYPLIGFLFQGKEESLKAFVQERKSIFLTLIIVIAALVFGFGNFGFITTVNLLAYYHHTFFFFLWAMGVVVLWVLLVRFLFHKFPGSYIFKSLQWLGKNITAFYVIQWLIIGNIATAIYQTQNIDVYIYWFLAIFSLTTMLTWLFGNLKTKMAL